MSKFTYTFVEDDVGEKKTLTATYNDLTASITLNVKKKTAVEEITPGLDSIDEADISGSFPTGLSDSYFSIIYHTLSSYSETLDVAELNSAARVYLANLNGDDVSNYSDKTYYGKDNEGIFVVIPSTSSNIYNNNVYEYDENNVAKSYKVYIAGTCDIVDIGDLPNNVNLTLANGYYYDIDNKLYLFLNTRLNMVYFSSDYSQFWYSEDDTKKTIISNDTYKDDSYYLKHSSSENANNLASDDSAMMIVGGVIDSIITSNTLVNIQHFCGCPNVPTVILSDNLTEVGDYAFAGSSISGTVSITSDSKITKIGKYAFKGCSNIKLFQNEDGDTVLPSSLISIDDYAFYGAPGLKGLDLTNCSNLTTVGLEAFGSCGNLGTVSYLQSQIEPDKNTGTRLLYLPPEKGTSGNYVPRVSGSTASVTASYKYDYTNWIADATTDEEKAEREVEQNAADNNYCFKYSGPSVITWYCK